MPLDSPVDAPFDFVPRRWRAEFDVTPVEEVLSDEGKFERRCGLPGHAKIELSVGSYQLILDRAYVASIRVQLQLRGQVQR